MHDDDAFDLAGGPEDAGEVADERQADVIGTEDADTTMAAGARSGAAGVANAELGTSGPPAEDILSPEELAQTEVTGGAGLDPNAITGERLADYMDEGSTEGR
jgi:hypothetical protein